MSSRSGTVSGPGRPRLRQTCGASRSVAEARQAGLRALLSGLQQGRVERRRRLQACAGEPAKIADIVRAQRSAPPISTCAAAGDAPHQRAVLGVELLHALMRFDDLRAGNTDAPAPGDDDVAAAGRDQARRRRKLPPCRRSTRRRAPPRDALATARVLPRTRPARRHWLPAGAHPPLSSSRRTQRACPRGSHVARGAAGPTSLAPPTSPNVPPMKRPSCAAIRCAACHAPSHGRRSCRRRSAWARPKRARCGLTSRCSGPRYSRKLPGSAGSRHALRPSLPAHEKVRQRSRCPVASFKAFAGLCQAQHHRIGTRRRH